MVHQPSGGFQGQATDIEIQAEEILQTRARLNEIYAQHTGQTVEAIEDAMERDKFMSPEEAKAFGLIDEVVVSRPPERGGCAGAVTVTHLLRWGVATPCGRSVATRPE